MSLFEDVNEGEDMGDGNDEVEVIGIGGIEGRGGTVVVVVVVEVEEVVVVVDRVGFSKDFFCTLETFFK